MLTIRAALLVVVLSMGLTSVAAFAQDVNLQPKYGALPKSEVQKAADEKFLAGIDVQFKGNRKKGAEAVSGRGWQLLRQGNIPEAMRRFNQAWLIDHQSGSALWGMAAIQASAGKIPESLKLFGEAERFVGEDIDFSVDYAGALGIGGGLSKNDALLKDAFGRFNRLSEKAPQHTLNLQNWAITLFFVGNYTDAWKKIQLAEATPRHAELDSKFIAALQSKMPRP